VRRAPAAGPGLVLAWVYGMFVVAAGARSAVQLGLHASRAPVAYALSAVAALGYAVGLALVLRADRRGAAPAVRAARVWCGVELAGVVAVGTASVLAPAAFPDATVWSSYGAGYGFVGLLLPVLVLRWLRGYGRSGAQDLPARGSNPGRHDRTGAPAARGGPGR
jgi:hypothetical protein